MRAEALNWDALKQRFVSEDGIHYREDHGEGRVFVPELVRCEKCIPPTYGGPRRTTTTTELLRRRSECSCRGTWRIPIPLTEVISNID